MYIQIWFFKHPLKTTETDDLDEPVKEVDLTQDFIIDYDLAKDEEMGVMYLAGHVASKFHHIDPSLGSKIGPIIDIDENMNITANIETCKFLDEMNRWVL